MAKASNELPPWGISNVDDISDIESELIPPDWKPPNGSPRSEVVWKQWLGGIAEQIGEILWPQYVRGGADWNTPHVRRLIDADFELLERLQPLFYKPIKARSPTTVTHEQLFLEEDDEKIAFGRHYERYDPFLSRKITDQVHDVVRAGFHGKVSTLTLQLKNVFQRPRAYQVAFIQNRKSFRHHLACTGATPSLVSGHCLQSAMGGCNAFVELSPKMNRKSIDTLQQFTVDIGDRRVFAGVHYPSDSLASFLVALKLIPHVFEQDVVSKVKCFMWGAISTKSPVFAAMKRHASPNKKSPYRQTLEAIEREAS